MGGLTPAEVGGGAIPVGGGGIAVVVGGPVRAVVMGGGTLPVDANGCMETEGVCPNPVWGYPIPVVGARNREGVF